MPNLTRRSFNALVAGSLLGGSLSLGDDAKPLPAPSPNPGGAVAGGCRVLVWDERQPKQKEAYDNWLGNAIAEHLKTQPEFEVRSVALADPEQGLTEENLNFADVLVWWGHVKHRDVLPNVGKKIVERIRAGKLSLVALHSAHWSTPFVQAMYARTGDEAWKSLSADEQKTAKVSYVTPLPYRAVKKTDKLTPDIERKVDPATGQIELIVRLPACVFPSWREDGAPSHVTVLEPEHPITKGLPKQFDIPHTEMYSEPFHVPKPDATLFHEKWDKGEEFKSGLIWNIGKGKVFYFRPGHESYGVYKEPLPLKIVENACRWLAEEQRK